MGVVLTAFFYFCCLFSVVTNYKHKISQVNLRWILFISCTKMLLVCSIWVWSSAFKPLFKDKSKLIRSSLKMKETYSTQLSRILSRASHSCKQNSVVVGYSDCHNRVICSVSCVWFYRLNCCLCLLLPSWSHCGYPRKHTATSSVLSFRKWKHHLLSKKQSRWLEWARTGLHFPLSELLSEVADIMLKPINRWITSNWTLTSAWAEHAVQCLACTS